VLPNGHYLLAITRSKDFPGGGAVELLPDGKVIWQYKGTQSEVNTVQLVGDGRYMLTEAGAKPRLLEVDRDGKTVLEFPLQAQTGNTHLQTRMARKLKNGNYLVPQLLDKVVREYTPEGKIVWEAKTPEDPKEAWPFTAIRLENGNTLTTCTHGKLVVEFDRDGKIVWQVSNSDLPEPLLVDPCGAQRLPNGNTVITSYGQSKPGEVKMLEVTPEKKVVWTYRDDKKHGIHEFQILDTNGKPLDGPVMK
jgi:outer membrane protein assembly factor BamB